MAVPNWTSAALASWESAAFAADMPVLGVNVLTSAATCVWNNEGTTAGADHTATGYPVTNASDGLPHLPTKPTSGVANTMYYVIDFGTGGVSFDFVALMGCNFATWLPSGDVILELDNGADAAPNPPNNPDGTFANVVEVANFGQPTTNARLCDWDCHHTGSVPLRYSDVRYARLKLVNNAAFAPEIGELIIGARCQLKNRPLNPFSKDGLSRQSEASKSASGVIQRVEHSAGAYEMRGNFKIADSTQVTNIRNWFVDSHCSFLWCWTPTAAGNTFHLMSQNNDDLSLMNQEWNEQDFTIDATEQGPERFYLVNQ